jgi:hypothetical protein
VVLITVVWVVRNALRSWKALDRDVDVIVFGDDEGIARVCQELGLRHELRCYVNCGILLMQDFAEAVRRVCSAQRELLMAERRWDVDIAEPLEFANAR